MTSKEAINDEHLEKLIETKWNTSTVVLNFWAEWAEPCLEMNKIFDQLSRSYSTSITFIKINVDNNPISCEKYRIDCAPTYLILEKSIEVKRIIGSQPKELALVIEQKAKTARAPTPEIIERSILILEDLKQNDNNNNNNDDDDDDNNNNNNFDDNLNSEENIDKRIKNLIKMAPVMLFLKGTKNNPQCGFSRQILEILDNISIDYTCFDILSDNLIREELKRFSGWPTYPQLYIKGELIGGLDIIKEMLQTGELQEKLKKSKDNNNSLLNLLIKQEKVMVFGKGTRINPRCGYTSQLIAILDGLKVKFGFFDILEDQNVRQGLKELSNWPTFPQLYLNGELIGGLDIIKEMVKSGELQQKLC